ncbi:hypothetical protein PR202_gb03021 [Eleusine coracana subsp. coracana]|uniref:RBR-type E3 ubiquitin transferase n=1 Tax=Eleusine coracana subsp. coracana TaxID=191504 RepID=A0AAV5E0Q5_ELECO|nr:hypothetical protein PR202_gb03021 [Eleusine coracana subsp. coracana]
MPRQGSRPPPATSAWSRWRRRRPTAAPPPARTPSAARAWPATSAPRSSPPPAAGTVRCPDASCAAALDPELCRAALPADVFERWCAALCEALFLGARRTYCPFPDCSEMMVADDDQGSVVVTQSECQVCRRLFCARCGVAPWHIGVTCDEYGRLRKGDSGREDMMLLEMAAGRKWKRCPSCQFFVEKSEGCNNIRCRCGFQFCYVCGTSSTSGSHSWC